MELYFSIAATNIKIESSLNCALYNRALERKKEERAKSVFGNVITQSVGALYYLQVAETYCLRVTSIFECRQYAFLHDYL